VTAAITIGELLAWNQETSGFWRVHLEANPALLELPCGIGGAATVMEFVAHIWGVELRWAQRIAGLPVTDKKDMPSSPLNAVYDLHLKAVEIFKGMLDDAALEWDEKITIEAPWLKPSTSSFSRRKLTAHALFHGQRHWAQLATLVRAAGFPSGFGGDILLSSALE
jgi:uncharacterized damage-inducible protein DinB